MKLHYFKLLIIWTAFQLFFTTLNAQEEANVTINRIMPLGDSITYGYRLADSDSPRPTDVRTAYRNHLWYMLQDANMSVDFVGSKSAGQAIVPPFDPNNEGHIGWSSSELAAHTYEYMIQSSPDSILLHIGTNDRSSSVNGVASILDHINFYRQQSGKNIKVYVALIINTQSYSSTIAAFNKNLKKLLNRRMMQGESIILVDMEHQAELSTSDYVDNFHPNDSGYQKIAVVWYNALTAPYTPALYTFPATVVDTDYITSYQVFENQKKVEFTTKVPDDGIKF